MSCLFPPSIPIPIHGPDRNHRLFISVGTHLIRVATPARTKGGGLLADE